MNINFINSTDEDSKIIKKLCKLLLPIENKEISFTFMNEDEIAKINSQFRKKNTPTNVLSFSSDEDSEWGDVIICKEIVAKEALSQKKSLENHLTHIILHGILHILGYNHVEDDEAFIMEKEENNILNKLNIANPYLMDEI